MFIGGWGVSGLGFRELFNEKIFNEKTLQKPTWINEKNFQKTELFNKPKKIPKKNSKKDVVGKKKIL